MTFRVEVKQHLRIALGSIEERLREEVATGLQAARAEIAVSLERDFSAGGRMDTVRPALERSITEVVEQRISERFGRLAAELWSDPWRASITTRIPPRRRSSLTPATRPRSAPTSATSGPSTVRLRPRRVDRRR